ncbi:MAG: pyridoxal-phosphate dependent enzyme [Gemmatimonadaceae bacterium]
MTTTTEAPLPIVRRFPAVAAVPRARLGDYPTPVQHVVIGSREFALKRDDRCGTLIGGNKVRGLEFLLGGVVPGDAVLTVGPRGSTHALATARCATALGATVTVVRWNQVMNDAARRVDNHLRREARILDARWVPSAYAVAAALRMRRRVRWIPAGGASALAVLGHVNAALELARQVGAGECTEPDRVYVPLGTGGTAAGLSLGLHIAGLATRVRAVRVAPRIIASAGRIRWLANAAARLIERLSGERVPRVPRDLITVEHDFYGGAYGRPLGAIPATEATLAPLGIRLDDTYSRKAFAAAAAGDASHPLLWLTFDGRLLQD